MPAVVALLIVSHPVFSTPGSKAPSIRSVRSARPVTGTQTALPVTAQVTTPGGDRWLRIMLPGRPNSAQGWIREQGTVLTTTSWRIIVKLSLRRVLVYRDGRLIRSMSAIVGKPTTPTPLGRFFVEESVRMPAGGAGAPFALALSARSAALQKFEGGPGQIALHGTANLTGNLGTASSHGCVRLAAANIRWLAARITPGVPVTISR